MSITVTSWNNTLRSHCNTELYLRQKEKETRFFASLNEPNRTERITSILPGPRQPSVARLDENKPTMRPPRAPAACADRSVRTPYVETSRTIIRATQLRLLPGVHPWS